MLVKTVHSEKNPDHFAEEEEEEEEERGLRPTFEDMWFYWWEGGGWGLYYDECIYFHLKGYQSCLDLLSWQACPYPF